MDESKPPPTRNSSRTLAQAAVVVLVVIAIAGIVLATLRRPTASADAPVVGDATPAASSAMTASRGAASTAATVRSVLEQNKVLLTRMTVNAQSKALGEARASELNRVAAELN